MESPADYISADDYEYECTVLQNYTNSYVEKNLGFYYLDDVKSLNLVLAFSQPVIK